MTNITSGRPALRYGVVAIAIWATSRTSARQVAELTLETEAETVGSYIALTGRLDAPEFVAAELEPFPVWLRAYDGNRLVNGNVMVGPCIIEEPGTTIVVWPGQEALLDRYQNYIIEVGEA